MKTFIPAESFDAYPGDVRTRFVKGVETAAYPVDFVDMLEAKGLVDGKPKDVGTGAGKRPAKNGTAESMVPAQTGDAV